MKPVQLSEYFVNTVDNDCLVHQGIKTYGAEYALVGFQLFMG